MCGPTSQRMTNSTHDTSLVTQLLKPKQNNQYVGRFAPSPSGLLHFGSLIAALGSYLQARSQNGKWLVRMEDIDPPREMPGADIEILKTLEAYGLYWDDEVLYQSKQSELYLAVLEHLEQHHLSYACRCTRKQIRAEGGLYLGHCKHANLDRKDLVIRLHNDKPVSEFDDLLQGHISVDQQMASEDFIILRKDGYFAYQLAVVVDDIYQGITQVVRGADLIDPTARQLSFFGVLGATPPEYLHLPLAVTEEGLKLSKQNKSPPICNHAPQQTLLAALEFLGQNPPKALVSEPPERILAWAVEHWNLAAITRQKNVVYHSVDNE